MLHVTPYSICHPPLLLYPQAACHIKSVMPDARIMIVLRDPVERALSQWNMIKVMGGGVQDFKTEVRVREGQGARGGTVIVI